MIICLIILLFLILAFIPIGVNAQTTTSGDLQSGWGLKTANNTGVVDTALIMSVQRASDSINAIKITMATKLASAAVTSAFLFGILGNAYATPTNSIAFTNKTGNVSQWSNDASYLTNTSLSGYVQSTRSISTTSPLSGGGDLSADRTLSIANSKADNATKGAATFDSSYFNDNSSGLISWGVNYGTGSVSANAVTINQPRGKVTYTSPSISAGTAIAVTFTNSYITSTSIINIGLNGNGSNLTGVNCYIKSQTAGSCVINIQNLSLLSLFNSTFLIDFFIVN